MTRFPRLSPKPKNPPVFRGAFGCRAGVGSGVFDVRCMTPGSDRIDHGAPIPMALRKIFSGLKAIAFFHGPSRAAPAHRSKVVRIISAVLFVSGEAVFPWHAMPSLI